MLVKWRPKARLTLWKILDYIGDRNPIAAANLFDAIEQTTQALPQHPYLYRLGRASGTRAAFVANPSLREKHLSNSGYTSRWSWQ
jgi:toxin ParE1/3/4